MRTTFLKQARLLFLCAALVACHEDKHVDPAFESALAPATLENALFYASAEGKGGEALTLDVATKDAKVIHHELPAGPIQVFARPGSAGREVVVFTGGMPSSQEGKTYKAAVPAYVLLFSRAGETLRQQLSGQYSQITLTDDGKFAIAFGSAGNFNLQNSVDVISFDKALAKDATAAVKLELSVDGRAPTSFVFEPSGGTHPERRLAISPLQNALQIVDVLHPERGEISIKLSDTSTLQPAKIVFADEAFFVQCTNSNEILSFQIIEQARGMQPFQFAPSVPTTSAAVTDLTTVGAGDTLRLLALNGRLEVLDPRVDSSVVVDGVSRFSQIYKFTGSSPVDPTISPRAALYAVGGTQLGFVDLGDETAWATRNVELIELGDPLTSLVPVTLPNKNLVLATHSTSRVSVIDLDQRTVKPVRLDSSSSGTLLDPGAPAGLQLWVATQAGRLGVINLTTFASTEVPLSFDYAGVYGGGDKPATTPSIGSSSNLRLVPGPVGTTTRRIAVLENGTSGRVTLLDADNPTAASALEVLGFFLSGLFD